MKPIIEEVAVKLDLTTNTRLKIVTYLFETLSTNNNVLKITTRELSEVLNVCTNTVTLTLKRLEQGGIIKRRTGTIMLQSGVLCQWHIERGHDSSTHRDVNINIQMDQNHFGNDNHPKQNKRYDTREEEREVAFTALTQQQNAVTLKTYENKLREREEAVMHREETCAKQEASLMERERTLRQWEERLDALLGLKMTTHRNPMP